jgi:hypothetical protein
MKRKTNFLWLLVFSVTCANAAQLYRWVDSKGNVEWRDTPPPASVPAKNVQQRKLGENVISGENSYSLQQATKSHPVTLWATDCGALCTDARALLNRRGVPFTEKTPQSDFATFKKLSPGSEIPLLQVGTIQLKGYLESEWDSTLDSAGYPRSGGLVRPKPAAAPAAAPKPAADGAKPADSTQSPAAK